MWTYKQSSGELSRDGIAAGTCYSGSGSGLNNPAMESVRGVPGQIDAGPIPAGSYNLGKVLALGPGNTGKYVVPVVPDAKTRARIVGLGRDPDSFYCHGDNPAENHTASEGCIIASPLIRQAVVSSGDTELTVIG